jgi:DNA-binding transcriptional MerR regulator
MEQHYSLTELSQLTELSPRTIRFYMSKDLVDKPLGSRKTAYYTDTHLQQLLTVINWQKEGLSLDDIHSQLHSLQIQTPPKVKPGDVQVMHRIHIADGIELNVDLIKTQLSQTQIRQLADHLYGWLEASSQKESADV